MLNQVKNAIYKMRHSPIRFAIWPIRSYELPKFLPIALLMLLILLTQNLVRNIKDGIVVTNIGTEVLSYIKLWGEMPMGVLFVIIYTKLCNIMTTEQVFRIVVTGFLLFFGVFAFFIYPNQEFFHPDPQLIQHYTEILPNMKWFIRMWGQWTLVLYYIMGELWTVAVYFLFFWQLANKIINTEEAKKFYIFFGLLGQTNLLLSARLIRYFTNEDNILNNLFDSTSDSAVLVLKSMTFLMMICGALSLLMHRYIEVKFVHTLKNIISKNKRTDILKLTISQSAKMVLTSRYLALICLLMIAYSTSINLIEGLWMSRARALYPSTKDFMSYQGDVLFWTGVSTFAFIFLGNAIIKYFGWFWGAVMTPLVTLVVGTLFFVFVLAENYLDYLLPFLTNTTPLAIVVFVGGVQNAFSKGVKYSLFDATKEMVYIPLDNEMKVKGKAAVDVLGTKLGKSIGALVQMISFTIFPNCCHEDISAFLMTLFIFVCIAWIVGVKMLNRSYTEILKGKGYT